MAGDTFTRLEVESHNKSDDIYIIINNVVYDVSKFIDEHPGGAQILQEQAGRDASQCFHDVGHSEEALNWREQFVVGEVVAEERWPEVQRVESAGSARAPLTLAALVHVCATPLLLAVVAAVFYYYMF